MADDNESVLVKLTRMEGKLDLSNLRHDQHDTRFAGLEGRVNMHGERITGLESREVGRDGERRGMVTSGKLLLLLAGAAPVAIGAAILRAIGA